MYLMIFYNFRTEWGTFFMERNLDWETISMSQERSIPFRYWKDTREPKKLSL